MIYEITAYASGGGSIGYERDAENQNIVRFSVIPELDHYFVKYVVSGLDLMPYQASTDNGDFLVTEEGDSLVFMLYDGDEDITETPLTVTLRHDITITAYFDENATVHINAITNISYGSVYVSNNDEPSGFVTNIFARPYPDYIFRKWSDGVETNPRQITVDSSITIVAEYQKAFADSEVYQYRAYVKDQNDLTDYPKLFLTVKSFSIREDLLASARSTIDCLESLEAVSEGDVIVLIDPKGNKQYQGVVSSISENTVTASQMQSMLNGTWIYESPNESTIEGNVKAVLDSYISGNLSGCTYSDPAINRRLGGFSTFTEGSTLGRLPEKDGINPMNMESFLYSLYQDYGLMTVFDIDYTGTSSITIKKPSGNLLKIGSNTNVVTNIQPIVKVADTNKLVIFGTDGTYRTTFVATSDGIEEEPDDVGGRNSITQTKVVVSDDQYEDLILANLPEEQYNHKVTFDLRIRNSVYDLADVKLGNPVNVWLNGVMYDSVITGLQMDKRANENPTIIKVTCGKVRTSITSKINMKGVLNG